MKKPFIPMLSWLDCLFHPWATAREVSRAWAKLDREIDQVVQANELLAKENEILNQENQTLRAQYYLLSLPRVYGREN